MESDFSVHKKAMNETATSMAAGMQGPLPEATLRPDAIKIPVFEKLGIWISPFILLVSDYITVVLALLVAFYLRNLLIPTRMLHLASFAMLRNYIYLIMPTIFIGLMAYERMYTKRLPLWKNFEKIFNVAVFATILTIGMMFFDKTASQMPRFFIGISTVVCFIFLVTSRYIIKHLLVGCGLWHKPVIVIGGGKAAELLASAYEDDYYPGYKIVGIIDDDHLRPLLHKYRFLGRFQEAETIVRSSGIQDVIIATPGVERERLLDMIYRIQPYVKNVSVVPDLFGMPLGNIDIDTYFQEKTVTITLRNNLLNFWSRFFKRMFDLTAGVIIGILVAPLLVILAVLIKLDSPGPAFHNARRIGKNGKEFICYKFRTMYVHGDAMLKSYFKDNPLAKAEWEKFAKLRGDDPRVTRIGRFLRQLSLDELPQIFNVLLGNMSLVGPRPYLPRERERMGFYYQTIIEAKPGITGLWQVSGRNDVEFTGRLELDMWYVRNWSFWLDVSMLLKTVKVVFGKMGAY